MSAPEIELRDAISYAFKADEAVRAVLGHPVRLFKTRERGAAYPHASWGRAETRIRDGDDVALVEHLLTLDIWCRDGDAAEVTGAMRQALRGLAITLPAPWDLVALMPIYSDVFTTKDTRITRGIIRLKAVMGHVWV
jgi:hypothetical protein